ncbi:hypothetical protein MKW98_030548, partial [Papaver atlanticum]
YTLNRDPFEDKISLYEASQMLLDYENKDGEFFCGASIVRFNEENGWYYMACGKYKKQVENKNGKHSCPKCKNNFEGEIKDNPKFADITIFGFNVQKMVNYTSAEHVNYTESCEKLKITEENIQKQSNSYKVLKFHIMVKKRKTSMSN